MDLLQLFSVSKYVPKELGGKGTSRPFHWRGVRPARLMFCERTSRHTPLTVILSCASEYWLHRPPPSTARMNDFLSLLKRIPALSDHWSFTL